MAADRLSHRLRSSRRPDARLLPEVFRTVYASLGMDGSAVLMNFAQMDDIERLREAVQPRLRPVPYFTNNAAISQGAGTWGGTFAGAALVDAGPGLEPPGLVVLAPGLPPAFDDYMQSTDAD